MDKIAKMEHENGCFDYEGKRYVLVRPAYIAGTTYSPYYTAPGICPTEGQKSDGLYDLYIVTWYPTEEWLNGDRKDEGDACDWDHPDVLESDGGGFDLEIDRVI